MENDEEIDEIFIFIDTPPEIENQYLWLIWILVIPYIVYLDTIIISVAHNQKGVELASRRYSWKTFILF